jgi:hypothetical protein
MKLFPSRESSVSDIPGGDGKITHLFYSAVTKVWKKLVSRKLHKRCPTSNLREFFPPAWGTSSDDLAKGPGSGGGGGGGGIRPDITEIYSGERGTK